MTIKVVAAWTLEVGTVHTIGLEHAPMRCLADPDYAGYGRVVKDLGDFEYEVEVLPIDHPDVLAYKGNGGVLRVPVPVQLLRVGDVIVCGATDWKPETVTRPFIADAKDPYPSDGTYETDKHQGKDRWYCTASFEPEVVFSSNGAIAERIVDALERFPLAVRAEVLKHFCHCGERRCGKHR